MAFFKMDDGIIHSSLFDDDAMVLKVWITCLSLANQQDFMGGTFTASISGLARVTNLSREDVEQAMRLFQSPDPDSTTEKDEGRRLVRGPGQNDWTVVTWPEHQGKPETIRKRRQRLDGTPRDIVGHCGTSGDKVGKLPSVSVSSSSSSVMVNKGGSKGGKKKVSDRPEYTTRFEKFWDESWRRGNKRSAFDTWEHMLPDEQVAAVTVVGKWSGAFEQRDAQKRPHVVTWLNQRGWEDEVSAEYGKGKESVSPEVKSKYAKFTAGRKK